MPIYIGNDTKFVSQALTDADGAPVTSGDVKIGLFKHEDLSEVVAVAAATHDGSGVWSRSITAVTIDGALADGQAVIVRLTIGDPVVATFERLELTRRRR